MKRRTKLFILVSPLFPFFLAAVLSCSKKSSGNVQPNTPVTPVTPVKTDVSMWLTTPDRQSLIQKQNISLLFNNTTNQNTTINVDSTTQYQSIDGFGFALTGGSATLINQLPAAQQSALLLTVPVLVSVTLG